MVDMAHIAGLVAGGAHPSPIPHADIVTSTSHKTLRGPRGGFMVTNNEEIYDKYNKAVFPGWQGGPLMHVIAAKAVAFGEAAQPSFSEYAHAVVENAAALGEGLVEGGLRLVSGGTDNHLMLIDVKSKGLTGKEAEKMLAEQGIDIKKMKLAALMENQETIKRSVSKGMGVTILSKLAAEEELKNGTLLAFPLGSQGGKRMINLVYDAEYPLLPAAERFIKMIKRMYLKKENTGIGECK